MKKILWILAIVGGFSFSACSEQTEINEFESGNWKARNEAYIDSLALVARANQGSAVGQWKVLQSFHLSSNLSSLDNQDYVYAKILKVGDGEVSPLFTDSVVVNYCGKLIPTKAYPKGYIFDQNFYGDIEDEENQKIMVPTTFCVGALVDGWTTSLQKMHVGDIWRLYIPQSMGYGEKGSSQGNIPGNSTLVFDLYLTNIKKPVSKK